MKAIVLGASGMVGQGVLRELLLDPDVSSVLSLGRSALSSIADLGPAVQQSRLREIVVPDLADLAGLEPELTGYDACLFCLGVTSAGLNEDQYRHLTYGLTLSVAQTLFRVNPDLVFLYVSGAGTDSTGRGRSMWARVKGQTENALLQLPFRAAYMFRPGVIQPLHGIRSRTRSYRMLYTLLGPVLSALVSALPQYVTTTERLGRAMVRVAKHGYPRPILEARDIGAQNSSQSSPQNSAHSRSDHLRRS